ncbi:MAG: hypothetical protein J6I49_08095 [Bacteroidales bacterium]|nr:hypothetical protein [Bacteroidales bacterium]
MKKLFNRLSLLALLSVLATGCVPQEEELQSYTLNAKIERLEDSEGSGSKVHLVNERWLYWEVDDIITLGSDLTTSGNYHAVLIPSSFSQNDDWDDFNGIFVTSLPMGSKYFLGLHPHSSKNKIVGTGGNSFSATIHLPGEQPLTSDITFAKNVFPMVAWYGGSWDSPQYTPYNLDFQSLAGLARLQFFNETGQKIWIKEVILSTAENSGSSKKQLWGDFKVANYNTSNPHLVPLGGNDSVYTLTLPCESSSEYSCPVGLIGDDPTLPTFYVALPACKDTGSEVYQVDLMVRYAVGSQNGEIQVATVEGEIPIRRNGITYMRALPIVSDSYDRIRTSTLSGHGTAERPFLIYHRGDLDYIRLAFSADSIASKGDVYINNQRVDTNTHFKIMRNGILLNEYWLPIENFKGKLTYAANPASTLGQPKGIIMDKAIHPIFASIAAGSVVEGIPVYHKQVVFRDSEEHPAALCGINYGLIKDCRVEKFSSFAPSEGSSDILESNNYSIGGICHTNHGTIKQCVVSGTMSGKDYVGGICAVNCGTVVGCNASAGTSTTSKSSAKMGGICGINMASDTTIIEDCFFAATVGVTSYDWAGICAMNDGTIRNSYFSHTAQVVTDGSVGGIALENNGTIDFCRFEGTITGNVAGGICAENKGAIINSFVSVADGVSRGQIILKNGGTGPAGGLVARQISGTLNNSFYYTDHVLSMSAGATAGPLVGRLSGGTVANCYAWETMDQGSTGKFIGLIDGGSLSDTCYSVGAVDDAGAKIVKVLAADAHQGLVNRLNARIPTGGHTWQLIDDIPGLTPYNRPTKARAKQRRR